MTTAAAAPASRPGGNTLQLVLGTGAFAVCFAVFGSVSAMMPTIRETLGLSPIQVSIAVASTGNTTVYHRVNRLATFRVVTDAYEDGAVHLRPGYRVGDQAVPRGGVPLESAAGER